jgi:sodium/potassium-transporting ATPase subunit beta
MAIEDNSATVDGADKVAVRQPQQSKFRNFLNFVYDKKNGTVLGRTGRSWFEITVFYIIFYSCLAGFFAINMAIFLHTLDPVKPRYYGKGTIIGINPGMGYQPWIDTEPESTLIKFSPDDNKTYAKYVNQLDRFLKKYNYSQEDLERTRDCTNKNSNVEPNQKPCRFYAEKLLNDVGCGKENGYGYANGTPCILVTLNKLIDWEPVSYSLNSEPLEVKDRYNVTTGDVAIACDGEYIADQENMGELIYYPKSGIDRRYFPYRVDPGYRQAFAIVKFNTPRRGMLVEVECKAYSLNIIHDRTNRLGMVHFEVLVEPTANDHADAQAREKKGGGGSMNRNGS